MAFLSHQHLYLICKVTCTRGNIFFYDLLPDKVQTLSGEKPKPASKVT